MKEVEKIKVYIRIVDGQTVCLCHRSKKLCNRNCEKDIVSRDKFADWEKTFKRDRFGKSKL